ncbi:Retrovirus-related Pol polyprotein from transposon opus [Folsomia candida]|uniref:Retrovirus-related Pol polyprotein from transposon opus n=1 Tax=Folsomia candida TaxID=158441 RepID=A0A226D6X5_FOLCA|nr:Retrovirus-related Pol polyprotein from transposon opus [Folsomia candida]
MLKKIQGKVVIMGDEPHVTDDTSNLPGRHFFHSPNPCESDTIVTDLYVYSMIDLLHDFDEKLTTETQIRYIIRGLRPSYLEKINLLNPTTIDQILTAIWKISDTQFFLAQQGEATFATQTALASNQFQQFTEILAKQNEAFLNALNAQTDMLKKNQYHQLPPQHQQPYQLQPHPMPRPPFAPHPTNPNYDKVCNYCKKFGQVIAECRKRAWRNQFQNSTPDQQPAYNQGNFQGRNHVTSPQGPPPNRSTQPPAPRLQQLNVGLLQGEIGLINCYKQTIKLLPGSQPVRRPPYRKPAHMEEFERKTIAELLEKGIIRHSSSPWGLGVVLVEAGHKGGGVEKPSYRVVVDLRPLNKVTESDSFPIPNIQTVLEWVGRRNKFMSVTDVKKGFWGIPLSEESIALIAFISSSYGLFEWVRLPMGAKNGSAAYSRAISIVLTGLLWNSVLNFIDDIILADNTIESHAYNLEQTVGVGVGVGVGCALLQEDDDGKLRPVAYAYGSRTLNKAESNLNHKPLVGLKFGKNTTKISNKLTTWALMLQEHDYELIYKEGPLNVVPDTSSRHPIPEIKDVICNLVDLNLLEDLKKLDEDYPKILLHSSFHKKFKIENNILYNRTLGVAILAKPINDTTAKNTVYFILFQLPLNLLK